MKKMRSIHFVLFIGILCIIGVGCKDKRGCTDQYSDNYDPEASEDDDTCIPTTLKFVGHYEGQGQDDMGNQYEDIKVFINDSTATEPYQILIFIDNFDLPSNTLDGYVENQYDIKIPEQTISGVDPFQYVGSGSLSGRVLRMEFVRTWYDQVDDTTYVVSAEFYALKDIED